MTGMSLSERKHRGRGFLAKREVHGHTKGKMPRANGHANRRGETDLKQVDQRSRPRLGQAHGRGTRSQHRHENRQGRMQKQMQTQAAGGGRAPIESAGDLIAQRGWRLARLHAESRVCIQADDDESSLSETTTACGDARADETTAMVYIEDETTVYIEDETMVYFEDETTAMVYTEDETTAM
eukprot:4796714-Pleurochrysis_carterae.AAC.2